VQQVQASKEIIAKYEGLLNKEMSIARMKVEVLDQQVQKLVEKVAQQPLISPRADEKKETTEPSIAVVVPHPTGTRICGSEVWCSTCTHRRRCNSSPGKSRSA